MGVLMEDSTSLSLQVSQLDKERGEMEQQMKRLKQELHTAQLEMNKTSNQYKEAQNQIQMLSKEKGKLFCTNICKHHYDLKGQRIYNKQDTLVCPKSLICVLNNP